MRNPLDYFSGRPVVVTGCGSGIGAAVAKALLQAGSQVIGIDRKQPAYEMDRFVNADLGDRKSIASAVSELPEEVWSLFNCAGVSDGAADPATVVRVNFLGLRELTESIEHRIPGGGSVVSTSSLAGYTYRDNLGEVLGLVRSIGFDAGVEWLARNEAYVSRRGGYRVSKEAIVLYTLLRCWDLGERGVRINALGPGITDTPMLADSVKAHRHLLDAPPRPLGRRATADEQATVLIFLNSDWASYVNGQTVWSDGGMTTGNPADVLGIGERN